MITPFSLELIDELNEQPARKLRRALAGAFYGLLAGSLFALVASTIDFLLFPALPLGFNAEFAFALWLWLGPGLAVVGFASAWPYESWIGLLAGDLLATLILLGSNLPGSAATIVQKTLAMIVLFLPTLAVCLPVVIFLRWLAREHGRAGKNKRPAMRIAGLVLLMALLAVGGGALMRMSPRAVAAAEFFTQAVRSVPPVNSPLARLKGLEAHRAAEFSLFHADSATSTMGYDIRAEYADGYAVTCVVVIYPGRPPYPTSCEETLP